MRLFLLAIGFITPLFVLPLLEASSIREPEMYYSFDDPAFWESKSIVYFYKNINPNKGEKKIYSKIGSMDFTDPQNPKITGPIDEMKSIFYGSKGTIMMQIHKYFEDQSNAGP